MQSIIISFVIGFSFCFANSAVLVYFLYKRITELEKHLLYKDNPAAYAATHQTEIVEEPFDPVKELEREFRQTVMQDTVTDEDIEKFGMKEA